MQKKNLETILKKPIIKRVKKISKKIAKTIGTIALISVIGYMSILTHSYYKGMQNPNKPLKGQDKETVFLVAGPRDWYEKPFGPLYKPFTKFLAKTLGINNPNIIMKATKENFTSVTFENKIIKTVVTIGHGSNTTLVLDQTINNKKIEIFIEQYILTGKLFNQKENYFKYSCQTEDVKESINFNMLNKFLQDTLYIPIYPHKRISGITESYADLITEAYKKNKSLTQKDKEQLFKHVIKNIESYYISVLPKKTNEELKKHPTFYPLAKEQPDSTVIKLTLPKIISMYKLFTEKHYFIKTTINKFIEASTKHKYFGDGFAKNNHIYPTGIIWPHQFLEQIPPKKIEKKYLYQPFSLKNLFEQYLQSGNKIQNNIPIPLESKK